MKIHPFTFIYIFLAFYLKMSNYIGFLLFSLLHEFGHYLAACYFQFEIQYIMVLPFGAFLALNDFGKHPVIEELIMLLCGPLVNVFFMIVFYFLHQRYLLIINMFICLFNILPVYPLDGSKILHLLLSYFLDYQLCFQIQLKMSLLLIAIGLAWTHSLGRMIVFMYLFYQNIIYYKNYRLILIETILSDHHHTQPVRINYQLKYYRPYANYYYFHQQLYPLSTMKINLIKSIKSH